ncbi:MAG: fimbrillin family protein, partial [Prevotella sp.]|nr:fimbrillin family protein [Prevotella sp.]
MKMKKYIQSMMAFAAIVSFASCSSEDNNTTIENESATKVMTFTATQEGNEASTRAILSGTNIHWESDDKISLLYSSENKQFTLTGGAGSTSGKFSGEAGQSTSYTAVYPYQENASLSGNDVTNVTLPAIQYARDNSFDKNAALMMAQSTNTTLEFKNVVGYVKVKPTFNCTRIDLKAFDNSAVLAGTGTVSYNNGKPTLDLSETKDYAITLRGDIKANKYYYIAVPPVTLKAGWTIQFTASDGKVYSRKGTNSITFTRNKVTNLGEFATTGDYPARGDIVRADQEVDMGVFEINGKNYRLIFAKSNLTKDGLAANEYDYGDYFAWGATMPWYYSATQTWKPGKEAGFTQANAPTLSKTYKANDVLSLSDDAARQILGGDWQLPTREIWVALYNANKNKVYWGTDGDRRYDTISGIKGTKISKKDDPNTYIFLPAAGSAGTECNNVGDFGYYWSGTANSSTKPYYLYFTIRGGNPQEFIYFYYIGLPVRPVRLVEVSLAGSGQGETEGIEEDVFKY